MKKSILINILLFAATFITTTIAGTQWSGHYAGEIANWYHGLTYAVLILTFLTAHEMGHYIASRIHSVNATLPYFIPAPIPEMLFGTLGAVIKTKNTFPSRKALFDIGAAGPIAGFVVCIVFLVIGGMNMIMIGMSIRMNMETGMKRQKLYFGAIYGKYLQQMLSAVTV